jgi:hypothetical protein
MLLQYGTNDEVRGIREDGEGGVRLRVSQQVCPYQGILTLSESRVGGRVPVYRRPPFYVLLF